MSGVWIISENRRQSMELLNIGRQLADKMETPASTLLYQDREYAEECITHGADEVMLLPPLSGEQPPESFIPVIVEEARKSDPDLILLPATSRGKNMAALIAARLNVGLVSSCTKIDYDEVTEALVMERLAYGGAAVQKVTCSARPAMATIPPRTYDAGMPETGRQGNVRELPSPSFSAVKVIERKVKKRETKDISEARVVVCLGRGIEKEGDLAIARQLAEVLGGSIACTRPIAEEFHWLPEELCIGLSGVQVKPDLYLGIGVSGQVQHVTGIRNAKVIAAINKDENAPIFKAADFGIIGDLYDVMPELISLLKK
jgi:electron transfer flavoprotein alpha subunit